MVIMGELWDAPALEDKSCLRPLLGRGGGVSVCVCMGGDVFQDSISIPRGTCLLSKKA